MRVVLPAVVAAMSLAGVVFAQAQETSATGATPPLPSVCPAFPEPPTVPQGALTPAIAVPGTEALNIWLEAFEEVRKCRMEERNAAIGRSNELANYATDGLKHAKASAEGAADVPPEPGATPLSGCSDFPAVADLPAADKVEQRNVWVQSVNEAYRCRVAEIKDLRAQIEATNKEIESRHAAASAIREDWATRIAALEAEQQAASSKKKKR